jgi:signal transduction histidine kinase
MHQVFLNLLRNATHAIAGNGKVVIRITADEQRIYVAFADSGPGIPSDVLPHLFSPSFRSDGKRVRASLSLFTCLAVVKKHGGDIGVESRPGQGATFTVRLPRSLERRDPGL